MTEREVLVKALEDALIAIDMAGGYTKEKGGCGNVWCHGVDYMGHCEGEYMMDGFVKRLREVLETAKAQGAGEYLPICPLCKRRPACCGDVCHSTACAPPYRRAKQHVFYKDKDRDAPQPILDRNGKVVLALCRVCGQGEATLESVCPGKKEKGPAEAEPSESSAGCRPDGD
jgi:hypothetical protein